MTLLAEQCRPPESQCHPPHSAPPAQSDHSHQPEQKRVETERTPLAIKTGSEMKMTKSSVWRTLTLQLLAEEAVEFLLCARLSGDSEEISSLFSCSSCFFNLMRTEQKGFQQHSDQSEQSFKAVNGFGKDFACLHHWIGLWTHANQIFHLHLAPVHRGVQHNRFLHFLDRRFLLQKRNTDTKMGCAS